VSATAKRFDTEILQHPLSRGEVSAFRAALDPSAAPPRVPLGTRLSALAGTLPMLLFVAVVLLVGRPVFEALMQLAAQTAQRWTPMAVIAGAFVVVAIAIFGVFGIVRALIRVFADERPWERIARLDRFATANGLALRPFQPGTSETGMVVSGSRAGYTPRSCGWRRVIRIPVTRPSTGGTIW
jgi:hypothetical protein